MPGRGGTRPGSLRRSILSRDIMVEAGGAVVVASVLISLYTFYFLKAFPAGRDRLLFALPLIPILLALPWIFDPESQPASVALTAWVLTWLGGFKVLSFCVARGILASDWNSLSFFRFCLSLSFPVHIRPVSSSAPGSSHSTANNASPQGLPGALLSSALHGVLFYFNLQLYNIPSLPVMAVELVHCLSILLFLTAICDAVAALAKVLAGLEMQPYFNKPYLAASFADFWARRWNITVSSCLRDAVYEPIVEFLDKPTRTVPATRDTNHAYTAPRGGTVQQATVANGNNRSIGASLKAKCCGALATFLVSGLMHELIVYYITDEVTGEMILFFLLHGAFVTVESVLRGRGLLRGVPALVSVPFVVGTTFLTAHLLFFPPFMRSAATHRVIRQVKGWLGQAS